MGHTPDIGLPDGVVHGRRTIFDPDSRAERVPIAALRPADSPRLAGEDDEHIRVLADADAELPPVIVHRGTMRVIDGMHRLGAARLRGDAELAVRFFDGTVQEAFILAVRSNIAHGRPLSLRDRTLAAERIVNENPTWSDRAIAEAVGLGAGTVGGIRRRVEATNDTARQTVVRIGRDGRRRPLDSAEGRRRAAEVIRESPDASLREIARRSGVSPTTAQDVRKRMRRGEDPVPVRLPVDGAAPGPRKRTARRPAGRPGLEAALQGLQRDPALRFNESGRALVRWLITRAVRYEDWQAMSADIPSHCTYILAEVAGGFADEWRTIADDLHHRARRLA
ncbi:transcriptional regulator protein [Dactylosporangium sp. NPDC051541]|uniref:transcriptional regulator protein n=1 Tax=Dactylosporangium sp. NPDC051541 TaxID=3363977 RepID=UPI00378B6EA1